ncbi:MAG: TlpA family protein disulfide reductase [Planctomycetaceae bacterium]|jgi:thiol-disulfide isomerase/thioredoxin|nr:TlpA family protein disulfide reductase [Planctomycetaceae bacterium]
MKLYESYLRFRQNDSVASCFLAGGQVLAIAKNSSVNISGLKITFIMFFFLLVCSFKFAFAEEPKTGDAKSGSAKDNVAKDNIAKNDNAKEIDLIKQPWLVESANLLDKTNLSERQRMLWANSVKYQTIKDLVNGVIEVEYWANKPPQNITGKFVLIELWATWCPPCRRSLPLLEYFNEKYKNELVVVSICETGKSELDKLEGKVKFADIKSSVAVDTKKRFANVLGVKGIPHAVLIEPITGAVLWEGMPTQINYELSDEIMAKYLNTLKKPNIIKNLPKEPPFIFKESK